jgi:ribosomal protein L19E
MDRNELDLKLEERLRDLREQLRHLEMSREIDRKLLDLKVSI